MEATVDLGVVKSRQQAEWSTGDYAVIGTTLQIVGEALCEALDLRSGAQVLDVAAGNGNATLAAARRWCDVTSTDYVATLLEAGRRRAQAEGHLIKFQEADAEQLPFADGSVFKEITPAGYVEGSWMFRRNGKYYFMWSEGGWTGPDYAVAYAIGSSPLGPFERAGKILQQDPAVATGAGHHSVLHAPDSSKWYIVYHRRPLGDRDRNHRVVCIDEMRFDAGGAIQPVVITMDGVERNVLVK
jgi:hypothetical protein